MQTLSDKIKFQAFWWLKANIPNLRFQLSQLVDSSSSPSSFCFFVAIVLLVYVLWLRAIIVIWLLISVSNTSYAHLVLEGLVCGGYLYIPFFFELII